MRYPNLSGLSVGAPFASVPFKRWSDREDLVVGGCSKFVESGLPCYKKWKEDFIREVNRSTSANTIVMLSVGAGVLELEAIEESLEEGLFQDFAGSVRPARELLQCAAPRRRRGTLGRETQREEVANPGAPHLRSEVNSELNFPPNFEGLVLGCIDADFCK